MIGVISRVVSFILKHFIEMSSIEWSMISTEQFMYVSKTIVGRDWIIYCWSHTKVGSINCTVPLFLTISI